jgi:methionyl-tRNA formyltransferase
VLEPLKILHQMQDHKLVAVVSQPAKKAGRGKKLLNPAVATYADEHSIPCFQPEKASDPDFLEEMKLLNPDLFITAAYGQILTEKFLSIPKRGTINLHPSLLPKYRGATPVPAALINGDTSTGISILFTVKKLDAGHIILQKEFKITAEESSPKLTERMFAEAGILLPEALELLSNNNFVGQEQQESEVTHCRKISKEDGLINWGTRSSKILNCFRAFDPWPGSFTHFSEKRIVIESMNIVTNTQDTENSPLETHLDLLKTKDTGSFSYLKSQKSIYVRTQDGFIQVKRLKPSGSKSQDAASFWNGIKDKGGLSFANR